MARSRRVRASVEHVEELEELLADRLLLPEGGHEGVERLVPRRTGLKAPRQHVKSRVSRSSRSAHIGGGAALSIDV